MVLSAKWPHGWPLARGIVMNIYRLSFERGGHGLVLCHTNSFELATIKAEQHYQANKEDGKTLGAFNAINEHWARAFVGAETYTSTVYVIDTINVETNY